LACQNRKFALLPAKKSINILTHSQENAKIATQVALDAMETAALIAPNVIIHAFFRLLLIRVLQDVQFLYSMIPVFEMKI